MGMMGGQNWTPEQQQFMLQQMLWQQQMIQQMQQQLFFQQQMNQGGANAQQPPFIGMPPGFGALPGANMGQPQMFAPMYQPVGAGGIQ